MLKIELIYDCECPNVPKARENLASALSELNLEQVWQE